MTRIDWDAIRRRVDLARAATERMAAPGAGESQRILRARARILAEKPSQPERSGSLDVVEFVLGPETYAIETSFVRRIFPLTDLTPVPSTPAFVLGIVNLHGQTVSVVDIRSFFDLPEKGLTDLNKVIVLQDGPMSFGILADSILGIRRTSLADIQRTLPTLTGVREKYLRGVTGDRTVILDGEKLINDRELLVHHQGERGNTA